MPNPSLDRAKLRKRLHGFWCRSAVRQAEAVQFVTALEDRVGRTGVFGGMVRDFGLGGSRAFRSDIDLVVETDDPDRLAAFILEQETWKRNRFGGYRVSLRRWNLDVWPASQTWAFRKKLVCGSLLEDLPRTVFFSWDAAVYEPARNQLHVRDETVCDLASRVLDIVLAENPDPVNMTYRALKLAYRWNAALRPALINYLSPLMGDAERDLVSLRLEKPEFIWLKASFPDFRRKLEMHVENSSLREFRPYGEQLALGFDSGQSSLHG